MYPTKSMTDYMNEMQRLFPRNSDRNMFHSPTPNTGIHHYDQSALAQSSSSTDTSPDSFPGWTPVQLNDLYPPVAYYDQLRLNQLERRDQEIRQYESTRRVHPQTIRPDYDKQVQKDILQQINDTPYLIRRQRPIIGRKILVDQQEEQFSNVSTTGMWRSGEFAPQTPPNSYFEKSSTYELFPTDNKLYEFRTPVKASPPSYTISPRMSDMSPLIKTSPGSSKSQYSPKFSTPIYKEPFVGSTSLKQNVGSTQLCTFCRKNGETPVVYMTHALKEKIGNKNIVTCPILRSHVCSTCGASGDNAHTITYCPVLRSSNNGQPLQSTTITLKNTRVKSNGRRRY